MKIKDVNPGQPAVVQQAAEILVLAFQQMAPQAWPGLQRAQEELQEYFVQLEGQGLIISPERILRAAFDPTGRVLGWIGGIKEYNGIAWELHPLAVHPAFQGQGIGTALVADFEDRVRERGGVTVFLGTDDERSWTSLSGQDLYRDLWQQIKAIQNYAWHPYEFYQKQGYTIVGVIPDANGLGKPDILMAKRVG